jgi:polysaccharide export outer membrane protein
MTSHLGKRRTILGALGAVYLLLYPFASHSQTSPEPRNGAGQPLQEETTVDYNRRLEQLRHSLAAGTAENQAADYRIGAQDLLEIKVFEASDLNRSVRVSANGDISFPLLGSVQVAELTAQEVEALLEYKLQKYMKAPHVDVLVSSLESHPVSVVGAVKKPGVFQVRGPKTVLEMLSLAEGLADDAGDDVLVMRGAGSRRADAYSDSQQASSGQSPSSVGGELTAVAPQGSGALNENDTETVRVNLKNLLETGDPRFNAPVYPGDIVQVPRSGIIYVVGEVKKPGGFVIKSNEKMTVLKAMALAEGPTPTSIKNRARIIRTDAATSTEKKEEIPIDLGKILDGKVPDPALQPSDILFIPNSTGRYAVYRGSEAAISAITSLLVFKW